ncbi:hypothetical protein NL676_006756 [Syzygium grande]|nr:hypothetical protein NL676_006756 [Syzygium grande]
MSIHSPSHGTRKWAFGTIFAHKLYMSCPSDFNNRHRPFCSWSNIDPDYYSQFSGDVLSGPAKIRNAVLLDVPTEGGDGWKTGHDEQCGQDSRDSCRRPFRGLATGFCDWQKTDSRNHLIHFNRVRGGPPPPNPRPGVAPRGAMFVEEHVPHLKLLHPSIRGRTGRARVGSGRGARRHGAAVLPLQQQRPQLPHLPRPRRWRRRRGEALRGEADGRVDHQEEREHQQPLVAPPLLLLLLLVAVAHRRLASASPSAAAVVVRPTAAATATRTVTCPTIPRGALARPTAVGRGRKVSLGQRRNTGLFLIGLQKLGKGDWRGIARSYVTSRTPTQVASHAQKYFIRQTTASRRKRRSSLFDMAPDMATDRPLIPKETTLPPPFARDTDQPDLMPSLDLSLASESKPMVTSSHETSKDVAKTAMAPIVFPSTFSEHFPTYYKQVPLSIWPSNKTSVENKTAEICHHQVLKPIPLLPKEPVNVDELVGMSQLSLLETKNGSRDCPTLSLKLLGEPSRQSAFHANPVASPDLSKNKNNPIQAV